jgi:6-phosphogluconolactonase
MRPIERFFSDAGQMERALADEVAHRLGEAISGRGRATFVAAGGTTPAAFYRELAARPLEWSRVTVVPSDERWVPPTDPEANIRLLREHLLTGPAAAAYALPLADADSPEAASLHADARLREFWPPDAAVLGMGTDGHTASLFPGGPECAAALQPDAARLVAVRSAPLQSAASTRLSLTAGALLGSRWTALLLRGSEKLETYRAALSGSDPASMPVRVLWDRVTRPVQIFWAP